MIPCGSCWLHKVLQNNKFLRFTLTFHFSVEIVNYQPRVNCRFLWSDKVSVWLLKIEWHYESETDYESLSYCLNTSGFPWYLVKLSTVLYTVLYTVRYTPYSVNCRVYTVQCTLYCTPYSAISFCYLPVSSPQSQFPINRFKQIDNF